MQIGLYWSLLAGFLLGFAVSTLWEWFYFRRRRKTLRDQRIRELEAMLADQENRNDALGREEALREEWQDIGYRSPGVFLEAEAEEEVESGPGTAKSHTAQESPASRVRRDDFDTRVRTATAVRASPTRSASVLADGLAGKVGEGGPVTSTPSRSLQESRERADRVANASPSKREPDSVAAPARADDDYPDDLSKIKGIGEVYKQRLYAAGIYTWHQIANSSQSTLRAATKAYPSSNVDEWPPQAVALAEKHHRVGAVYTGPMPDDLTKITGIGPVGMQTLYRAGICTFGELAATSVETLSNLFPIAVAGDEPDFESWIDQARQLQTNKPGN